MAPLNLNLKAGLVHAQNFIDGDFEDSLNLLDSFNPSTGLVWAKIPNSTDSDVDRAVSAAKSASRSWADLGWEARARFVHKVADLLEERLDEFAAAESKDQGKPVSLAKAMDIPRAVLNLRVFANTWTHLQETANDRPSN